MLPRSDIRPAYSRAENISDAVVHVAGLAMAFMAVPSLIVLAVVTRGDGLTIAASAIYGACLIAMLLFSALYNMIPEGGWTHILRKLDHSAIYWKIAGTFTPFTLIPGGQAVWVLAGIWGAALLGTGIKVAAIDRLRWLALALYLGMGWIGVAAAWPVMGDLPTASVVLMGTGGVLYTLGVVFYLWEALPFHYTIWHVFVLVASFVFFAAVLVLLLNGPGAAPVAGGIILPGAPVS